MMMAGDEGDRCVVGESVRAGVEMLAALCRLTARVENA